MRLPDLHHTLPRCTCGRPVAALHVNSNHEYYLLVCLRDVTISPGSMVRGQCKACERYTSFASDDALRQAIDAQVRPVPTGRAVCLT